MQPIINIHAHTFTFNHVPVKFIPFMNTALWATRHLPYFIDWILPERAEIFMKRGIRHTQMDILNELAAYYPDNTRFAVHTVDFEQMGAGKCRKGYDFISQLDELAKIKASPEWNKRLYPFVCVDPRRIDSIDIARHYILEKGFTGIKLYSPLGYFPDDYRLHPMWAWAEKESIPIMTHCSRSGPVYGRHNPRFTNPRKWADRYTAPSNYISIFDNYPDIKICFAHFGGEYDCTRFYKLGDNLPDNWFATICSMLKKYRGAYADISYTGGDSDLMALFHVYAQGQSDSGYSLSDKILFGSDYYMAHLTRNERWFSINVRSHFGEATFDRMMTSAAQYLSTNLDSGK